MPTDFSKPITRQSLGEAVYERIAKALIEGRFVCGEELNEVALAKQFQVSRTPVREALRRLTNEGFVVNTRHLRATVVTPSREEIEETYQVRQILETAAARMAATRIAPEKIAELQALAAAAVPGPSETWGRAEMTFDFELHRSIAEACGNSRLKSEIERYGRHVRFVRSQVCFPAVLRDGHGQHLRIVEALQAQDPGAAAAAMEDHIAAALGSVLESLAGGFIRPKQPVRRAVRKPKKEAS